MQITLHIEMGCLGSKPRASTPAAISPREPSKALQTAPQDNPQEGKRLQIDPSASSVGNKGQDRERSGEVVERGVIEGNKGEISGNKGEIGEKKGEIGGKKGEIREEKGAIKAPKGDVPEGKPPVCLQVDLHTCYLSGKWYILRNAVSQEISPELNRLLEEGFHTGVPIFTFNLGSGQCSMDYALGEITFLGSDENKVFSIARKISDFAELLWTGEDGIQRPFPPEVETLILSHPSDTVLFEFAAHTYQASLSSLSLQDTTTHLSFPLQRL